MDPASLTASIIAILQLTATVLSYLNDVKNASKDRRTCAVEASQVYALLTDLMYQVEEANPVDPWFCSLRKLGAQNGALDQFKSALEDLASKVAPGHGIRKIGRALVWKFSQEEISSIISRIERVKTLVQIALQKDQL